MSTSPQSVFGPDLRAALVAMVRKRVPEREVEDIVQATLADAFESPHAPKEAEALRRWIFGVAKNKVVDYHRRAGRETFEVPEVAGQSAPHTEADLLRWAEKNLPPGEENKTTLDWMLREGEGEKLEWIAETEDLPAPRVRQRVSRLRRHLKTHWQKEVALLAALGVAVAVLLWLRRPEEQPIANEDVARAEELRKQAFEKCLAGDFKPCVDKLDDAKRLDPAGDTQPAVQKARENAAKALTPNDNVTPPPAPTLSPPPAPEDSTRKLAPPLSTGSATPPPVPRGKLKGTSFDFDSSPAPQQGPAPAPAPTPKPVQSKSDDLFGPTKSSAPPTISPKKPSSKSSTPRPAGTDDWGSL